MNKARSELNSKKIKRPQSGLGITLLTLVWFLIFAVLAYTTSFFLHGFFTEAPQLTKTIGMIYGLVGSLYVLMVYFWLAYRAERNLEIQNWHTKHALLFPRSAEQAMGELSKFPSGTKIVFALLVATPLTWVSLKFYQSDILLMVSPFLWIFVSYLCLSCFYWPKHRREKGLRRKVNQQLKNWNREGLNPQYNDAIKSLVEYANHQSHALWKMFWLFLLSDESQKFEPEKLATQIQNYLDEDKPELEPEDSKLFEKLCADLRRTHLAA